MRSVPELTILGDFSQNGERKQAETEVMLEVPRAPWIIILEKLPSTRK